jgi:hypothetical protein
MGTVDRKPTLLGRVMTGGDLRFFIFLAAFIGLVIWLGR